MGAPAEAVPTLPPPEMKVVSKSSGLAGKIVGAAGAIGIILGSVIA